MSLLLPCRPAVGLIPADVIHQHSCSAVIYQKIDSACIPDQNPQNILGSQHLFSVYIHAPPGQQGERHCRSLYVCHLYMAPGRCTFLTMDLVLQGLSQISLIPSPELPALP